MIAERILEFPQRRLNCATESRNEKDVKMSSEKWKVVALILIVLGGIKAVSSDENDRLGMPGTADWVAYWNAARLARAGENPYDEAKLRASERTLGLDEDALTVRMWNPPWVLVLLVPWSFLPFFASVKLWMAANVAAMLACGTIVWRLVANKDDRGRIGVAWAATAAFIPLLFMLHMGQISGIMLVGIVGFLACAERGRAAAAGAFLALTMIKPHVVHLVWIAALWWMIVERKWGFAAGAASVLLPATAALAIFAPRAIEGYRIILEHPPLFYRTPTLGGILRDLAFRDRPIVPIAVALASEALFLVLLIVKRPILVWKRDLGPILLASVPTAAYGWCFDQVVLLVPYLMIVVRLVVRDRPLGTKRKFLAFASLIAIAAAMVAQNVRNINDVYLFWPPLRSPPCSRRHPFSEVEPSRKRSHERKSGNGSAREAVAMGYHGLRRISRRGLIPGILGSTTGELSAIASRDIATARSGRRSSTSLARTVRMRHYSPIP